MQIFIVFTSEGTIKKTLMFIHAPLRVDRVDSRELSQFSKCEPFLF